MKKLIVVLGTLIFAGYVFMNYFHRVGPKTVENAKVAEEVLQEK